MWFVNSSKKNSKGKPPKIFCKVAAQGSPASRGKTPEQISHFVFAYGQFGG